MVIGAAACALWILWLKVDGCIVHGAAFLGLLAVRALNLAELHFLVVLCVSLARLILVADSGLRTLELALQLGAILDVDVAADLELVLVLGQLEQVLLER